MWVEVKHKNLLHFSSFFFSEDKNFSYIKSVFRKSQYHNLNYDTKLSHTKEVFRFSVALLPEAGVQSWPVWRQWQKAPLNSSGDRIPPSVPVICFTFSVFNTLKNWIHWSNNPFRPGSREFHLQSSPQRCGWITSFGLLTNKGTRGPWNLTALPAKFLKFMELISSDVRERAMWQEHRNAWIKEKYSAR